MTDMKTIREDAAEERRERIARAKDRLADNVLDAHRRFTEEVNEAHRMFNLRTMSTEGGRQ